MPKTLATAAARPMTAMSPLSKYLNGGRVRPARRALMSLAAYFPPWMATWATPGRGWPFASYEIAKSPRTKISGWLGTVRSGLTLRRPDRSVSALRRSATFRAKGVAVGAPGREKGGAGGGAGGSSCPYEGAYAWDLGGEGAGEVFHGGAVEGCSRCGG